jgi:transglutaminase-like putative cysteine protease
MSFRKLVVSFLVFLLFFLFKTPGVSAQGEFLTDVAVEYRILQSGITQVTHTFTLENTTSNLYATSYKLTLDNIEPQDAKAFKGGSELTVEKAKEGDTVTLNVLLGDGVVGMGKIQTFRVVFTNPSFAVRTGEVWEISIPRLSSSNSFRSYSVEMIIPEAFGNEAYLAPQAASKTTTDGVITYKFDKDSIEKTGITAGFGAFQVFSFNLNYHLENPINKTSTVDIAIPPDTSLQKVYYQEITPEPATVHLDADGNWLASYVLSPRQRVDIQVKGAVQIFATVRPFPAPSAETLTNNLKETQYWQTANPQIKETARRLSTAREIYDFVVNGLSYDYDRVKPNVERLGAVRALNSPNNAICMEFTDLFVALARSAGIPAREINGFAYTENPEIQPLSLVADVLHSWPEYWDDSAKTWVPVDPTWGSTTGGVDFFSKLDLRHFTFVIHGNDPLKPYPPGSYKLGSNPQKDVFVNFGQLPEERTVHPQIEVETQKTLPFLASNLKVIIKNPGPSALYDLTPVIYFDKAQKSKEVIEVLPPYAQSKLSIAIPFSFLGKNTPDSVTIMVADSQLTVPTFKKQVIIYNLLGLSLILVALILFILIRLKKIRLDFFKIYYQKILLKIKNVRGNHKTDSETKVS